MVYVITGLFMLLDIITGIALAVKNKCFTSSAMREGLFHKCGSVLCLALGALVDWGQTFIDLGVNVPVAGIFCTYIITMEIGSIIENVGKINPEIIPEKIKENFTKLKGE